MLVSNREHVTIFPSSLFVSTIEDDINPYIDLTYKDKQNPNTSSFNTRNTWQSDSDLHEREEWKPFVDMINIEVADAMKTYGVINHTWKINNMWVSIHNADGYHVPHTHSNSFYSGIVYLKTYEGCGKLKFIKDDPVIYPDMTYNEFNCSWWTVEPQTGDMIMFPSWLKHSVMQSEVSSDEDRISLAFTVMPVGQTTTHTRNYNYSKV